MASVEDGPYLGGADIGDRDLANCGCVHHAEEGVPCKHDLAKWADEDTHVGPRPEEPKPGEPASFINGVLVTRSF